MKEAHAELEDIAVKKAWPIAREELGQTMLKVCKIVEESIEEEAKARYPALAAMPPLMQVIIHVALKRVIREVLDDLDRHLMGVEEEEEEEQ